MSKNNSRTQASAAVLALIATAGLHAQASAQTSIPNKWDVSTRNITVDQNLPYICDAPLQRAVATVNSYDPNFRITYGWNVPPTDNRSAMYYRSYGYGATNTRAQTLKSIQPLSSYNFWESYGTIVDADIGLNQDLIFWPGTSDTKQWYDLHCDANQQGAFSQWHSDYESILMHELGHFVGFEDRNDGVTPCAMSDYKLGTIRRSFCSAELSAYRAAY
ncbi:MAG: hypothetical protein VYE13_02335 [Pseudomonadota bacterium]|uniref:hypothetical protein n=2 Tax=Sphingomonadales TaxID=204457 RepID=UPI0024378180|nr:hypothetical protein [Pseudomonadota bacterium]